MEARTGNDGKRAVLGVDMAMFSALVEKFPPIASYSEKSLERRLDWLERHFRVSRAEMADMVLGGKAPILSYAFHTRILPRMKYLATISQEVPDIGMFYSIISMRDDSFFRRFHIEHSSENVERYQTLLRLGEMTKGADAPLKSKSKA